ncbi:MAG: DNA repair protein RadC [Candidatus Omnitrophica bacterium]|jgi:DNA repair protein RadC|nr:DNA repair protein RadC [Candidatus Omnitrophota bacterium]
MAKPDINSRNIKSWPKDDRPRERLLSSGEQSLSNSELLAILLNSGVKGESAVDLARNIFDKFGTFRNMSHTDIRDWQAIKGLGPAKICRIKAALEIGRRFRENEIIRKKARILSSKDIFSVVGPQIRDLKTEMFKIVFLDNSNNIISIENAAKGTINHTVPIAREIIHSALQKFAASIICVHNHPSGSCLPSDEDKQFTKELAQAANVLQIKLLDHVIIGGENYYSFLDSGLFDQTGNVRLS